MSEYQKKQSEEKENEKRKAWFEKDTDEWDENDEFEAFSNLVIAHRQGKRKEE